MQNNSENGQETGKMVSRNDESSSENQDESRSEKTGTKLSAVEGIKEKSCWLRGSLREEMASGADHFNDENKNLLKFHGSYQQEDRDARKSRGKTGTSKHYMFMIRLKLPGGKLTADQYLRMEEVADKHANGTLRLTTRQSIQFHGIVMGHLQQTMQDINRAMISTLGACGDVNRNVMSCPAPIQDGIRPAMQQLADEIAQHLAPRSNAYHDIWLDGKEYSKDALQSDGVEPIYGKVYLPRKFKIGFALPDDNCVDVFTQDLGFLAIVEHGKITGYDMIVGGGMGRSNGNANTFARLGSSIAFLQPGQVVAGAEAVVKLFRDHGNRADRKRARIKYVVHDWGIDKFRKVLAQDYLTHPLVLPKEPPITGVDLHLGWHSQKDGKSFLGISIENGRIKNEGDLQVKTALHQIITKFKPDIRITPQQDILLCDLDFAAKGEIESILRQHGVALPETLSMAQKWSMACPAIPTCGLAITESERSLPLIIDELEKLLHDLGLSEEVVSVRMTGCPNGCARPYQSEIGLVGRSGEKYSLYLGGSSLGTRMNSLFKDLVPRQELVPLLRSIFEQFKSQRIKQESFGDFCHRVGFDKLTAV